MAENQQPEVTETVKQEFVFNLAKESLPITVMDDKGEKRIFTIRDMDGNDKDTIGDEFNRLAKYDENGKPIGMKTSRGFQSKLISLCLYDDAGKKVPQDTIQAWPAKVIIALFHKARKLNGMDDDATEQAKNE